jgi:hypothetical protein
MRKKVTIYFLQEGSSEWTTFVRLGLKINLSPFLRQRMAKWLQDHSSETKGF